MEALEVSLAEPAPGIGHNQPPKPLDLIAAVTQRLATSHRDLAARFLDLEVGCARVPDPIGNDEDAALATDFIAQCQAHIRKAEAAHKREKEFFLKAGRAVDAFFKRRCENLTTTLTPTFLRLKTYRDHVAEAERQRHETARRAAEEEARRAEEDASRHRAEADRLAGEAKTPIDRRDAAEHLLLAEEATERAASASQQAAGKPEPVRIRGDYGSTAYVTRAWTFEIVDLDRVPREYMSLDADVVREAIIKDGVREIPGLRIFQEELLRVRGVA